MDWKEAKQALETLGLRQVDVAEEISQMTGARLNASSVSRWFTASGRGPSDACKVYLTMKLREHEASQRITRDDVIAWVRALPDEPEAPTTAMNGG